MADDQKTHQNPHAPAPVAPAPVPGQPGQQVQGIPINPAVLGQPNELPEQHPPSADDKPVHAPGSFSPSPGNTGNPPLPPGSPALEDAKKQAEEDEKRRKDADSGSRR
jgi:hypothetical protein